MIDIEFVCMNNVSIVCIDCILYIETVIAIVVALNCMCRDVIATRSGRPLRLFYFNK